MATVTGSVSRGRACVLAAAALTGGILVLTPAWSGQAAQTTVSPYPSASAGTNGRVSAVISTGGRVFLGGSFTTVSRQPRGHVAAVSTTSGAVTSWRVDTNGPVHALTTDGKTLYLGGSFSSVAGHARANLAAVRVSDGALLPWNPGTNRSVLALTTRSGRIFVGGQFGTIAGRSVRFFAVLGTSGGVIAAPGLNAKVESMRLSSDGSTLYIGGMFTTIAGSSHPHLAALSTSTAQPRTWRPTLGCGVDGVAVSGSNVYAACRGDQSSGDRVVAFSTSSASPRWIGQADGDVQAIGVVGGNVYVGGHFQRLKGVSRAHAAALDSSGRLLGWAPRFNSSLGIWSMRAVAGYLWVGGDFTTVNGASHPHLTRFALT